MYLKHLRFFNDYIYENKQNDINSDSLDKKSNNSDILEEYSFKKIDFYYLKKNIDETTINELNTMIDENEYRAFATFSENIEHFEDLNCTLIALVNYPAERFNKRTIINKLEEIKKYDFVDEIEFPWSLKYLEFGVEFWRDIIVDFSSKGYKLRPMIELGIYSNDDIKKVIDFFKKINILSIMTSSGLYSEMTTFEKWEEIKDLIPNKCEVKIGGVLTISDINKFLKSDVDLAATTISLKTLIDK